MSNHMNRRGAIKAIACTGLLASIGFPSCGRSEQELNILVLGGTQFVGPAIVNAALEAGHNVTLFNRGITNPDLFPNLPLIRGDRENGPEAYQALLDHQWDVIIDVWPEHAHLVDHATAVLQEQTAHYIFISSIAVYRDFQEVGLHEESEVVDLNLPREEWTYPEEKAAAEELVRERFPDRHTIVRAGVISGWRDPALDLLYWCLQMNRDEAIIAPGSGEDPLQFIDVKDVGAFVAHAVDNKLTGTFNCLGPTPSALLWRDFLALLQEHFQSSTTLVWASEEFLATQGIASFSDLPLWAPLSEDRGFMQISNQKLLNTGFQYRPITETIDDCMAWHQDRIDKLEFGTEQTGLGIQRTRELQLIDMINATIE